MQRVGDHNYYSFGAVVPGRKFNTPTYRYGFNGKEKEDEIANAESAYDDFGARIYDARLGRFLSIDPLFEKYPDYTPYLFAGNKPIWMLDRDGEEEIEYTLNISKSGEITIKVTSVSDSWFIPDYKRVTITYEGQKIGTYLFTAWGTNGDNSNIKPSGGAHNNLDQFDGFIMSIAKNPNGTLQNPDYTSEEEIKKDMLKEIAASIILAKLVKQRDIQKAPTPIVKKPYSNPKNRPSYGKGQDEAVWNAAKQADGKVYDPNTGEELIWDKSKPRSGQWDMGHKKGKEYRKLWKDYMDNKISKEEFIKQYRNPNNYNPESPSENRSRRHEPKETKKNKPRI
ncbi:MAG: HNH/ENDO VII family nuclease [Bacteroidia bacterium]|nr:HNH/ENDO VII family nuclease [Bacteroidia bacterium]